MVCKKRLSNKKVETHKNVEIDIRRIGHIVLTVAWHVQYKKKKSINSDWTIVKLFSKFFLHVSKSQYFFQIEL